MIKKSLLLLLYDAAHIQRWNDHIRPKGFTELDKQAHKMIISYILAKYEETDRSVVIDWRRLIEGGIFEFLHRIVLTDIKPPIFHRLMSDRGDELNEWVINQLKSKIENIKDDFINKFESYLFDRDYSKIEKKILKASHFLATNWEFQIIYQLNSGIFGIEETKKEIENELEEHYNLIGVQKIGLGKKTQNFVDLVGKLRFQQRWSQSPRVPETSVMGHMLIVAMLLYLFSLEVEACSKRICNNYFAGLFHDLPEVLTRDIISPVKNSIEGLENIIKDIENTQIEEKLLPLLPIKWHSDIKYFIEEEFKDKVIQEGKICYVSEEDISSKYNKDEFSPIDGRLLEACDHLAAYIEAYLSISHGIKSHHLVEAIDNLYTSYENRKVLNVEFGPYFEYFKL